MWGREADVIWMAAADGSLLILADDAELPIHVGAPGLMLWEALAQPRSLPDLAATLCSDGEADELLPDLRSLLDTLASLDACLVLPGGEYGDPAEPLG